MHARFRGTELFYDVDGTRHVPVEGEMVKRPVLFLLHGGPGGDHSSFKPHVGKLTDVALLVYIDHRGFHRNARTYADADVLQILGSQDSELRGMQR